MPFDKDWLRNLFNQWTIHGASSFVEKLSGRWFVRFDGYTYPQSFMTRKSAIESAKTWIAATLKSDHC